MSKSPAINLSLIIKDAALAEHRLRNFMDATGISDPRLTDAYAALANARMSIRQVVAEIAVQELLELEQREKQAKA